MATSPLAILLVVALVVVGLVIICNAMKNNEGLTLGSGATLVITTNIQDASRLIDQSIRATNAADATSLLRQASDKLQQTIDNITKAEQEFGSEYTDIKNQAISAKAQLDEIIKQTNVARDPATLQSLQSGVLPNFQLIIGKLYERLNPSATTTVTTVPVTYVQPQPTYYVRPIYLPSRPLGPPFPGPGPWPPGPHPGPGPWPPGPWPPGGGGGGPFNPPGTTPTQPGSPDGFRYHY